jgi:hypothetical protein
VPEDLARQFATMAALRAEQLTHVEQRKLDQEKNENERLHLEAQLAREAWAAAVRANISLHSARADAETQRIQAESLKSTRLIEAEADAVWLSNPGRSSLEHARADPLGHLIARARDALWSARR